jgi:hypothetical protein
MILDFDLHCREDQTLNRSSSAWTPSSGKTIETTDIALVMAETPDRKVLDLLMVGGWIGVRG